MSEDVVATLAQIVPVFILVVALESRRIAGIKGPPHKSRVVRRHIVLFATATAMLSVGELFLILSLIFDYVREHSPALSIYVGISLALGIGYLNIVGARRFVDSVFSSANDEGADARKRRDANRRLRSARVRE